MALQASDLPQMIFSSLAAFVFSYSSFIHPVLSQYFFLSFVRENCVFGSGVSSKRWHLELTSDNELSLGWKVAQSGGRVSLFEAVGTLHWQEGVSSLWLGTGQIDKFGDTKSDIAMALRANSTRGDLPAQCSSEFHLLGLVLYIPSCSYMYHLLG